MSVQKEIRQLVCGGCLGYGFDKDIFVSGIARNRPDYITYDCGSIDPGPYYLGEGVSFVPKIAAKIDLDITLSAAIPNRIPVILTTAGGSGANVHLDFLLEIIREIARERHLTFRVATISGEIEKEFLKKEVKRQIIQPLGPEKPLTEEEIDRSTRIVAQMGVEPIMKALGTGAEVILTGRACDEMAGCALPMLKGFDKGLAHHMGKILECGSQCIERARGRRSSVFGILREDHFLIEPVDLESKATVESVTKHCAYEERNPVYIDGPGGAIDASEAKFEQLNQRVVKVSGSRFMKAAQYTLKLEGAAFVGYRTIIIGGNRSQEMIDIIDWCLKDAIEKAHEYFSDVPKDDYKIYFHVYGKNGVMGKREPVVQTKSHELGIITEVVAKSPELADAVAHFVAGTRLHHMDYPGSLNRSCGNMAFMSSPLEYHNKAYEFNIHHLLVVDDPCKLFPITVHQIG